MRCCCGRAGVGVRVIVVPVVRVAEPREPRQALALRQHVGRDARLARRERVNQQIRLHLRDPRIVRQIGDVLRLLDVLAVVGRQARDGALEVAHRREVLVQTLLVGRAERRLHLLHVVADQIEHALLAVDPAFVLHAEQAIEQVLRNHLRRQRALVTRPAHVAVDVLAVRFLRHADLQRAEARLGADLRGEKLVDGSARRRRGRCRRCRSSTRRAR